MTNARLLGEILRLQRWAGGADAVAADRIFGLMHGFESTMREVAKENSRCINEQTEDAVESLLEEIESGAQSTDGLAIKSRLREMNVDEIDARLVLEMLLLRHGSTSTIQRLVSECSVFSTVGRTKSPESQWFGALHYVEVVDQTDADNPKCWAFFSAGIPRIGECIEPEEGQVMNVTDVRHCAQLQDGQPVLVPYVYVEPAEAEVKERSPE